MNKVNEVIEIIKNINKKDKLKLGICLTTSDWASLLYNKDEMYNKFDTKLKEFDEEYRTKLMNFSRNFNVMFAMAKIMEMNVEEMNTVADSFLNNYEN